MSVTPSDKNVLNYFKGIFKHIFPLTSFESISYIVLMLMDLQGLYGKVSIAWSKLNDMALEWIGIDVSLLKNEWTLYRDY